MSCRQEHLNSGGPRNNAPFAWFCASYNSFELAHRRHLHAHDVFAELGTPVREHVMTPEASWQGCRVCFRAWVPAITSPPFLAWLRPTPPSIVHWSCCRGHASIGDWKDTYYIPVFSFGAPSAFREQQCWQTDGLGVAWIKPIPLNLGKPSTSILQLLRLPLQGIIRICSAWPFPPFVWSASTSAMLLDACRSVTLVTGLLCHEF